MDTEMDDEMDIEVKLFLLGPFGAERGGRPLTAFKSDKVRALLAYLAVEREVPHHRGVLAGLLWPDSPDATAMALLRDVLSNLRRVLGDRERDLPIIRVEGDTLQINPPALAKAVLWLDLVAFSDLAAAPGGEGLERAVGLYRGDFLEGFVLADSPDFEAWVLLRRETFRRTMLDALYRLATFYLQRGDYGAAQEAARRQLALDGYREEAHRQLLRALTLAGQRNQALAHYADYGALLDKELGVAPDVRTAALYQRIRDGLRSADVTAPAPTMGTSALDRVDTAAPSFVGRASELAWLETRLGRAQQGEGQVVFVTGEAGSGKTMLVQAFSQRVLGRAEDVLFAGGACNAQISSGDPYLPFREILRLLRGDLDGTLSPAYAQRLEAFAPAVVRASEEVGVELDGWLVGVGFATAGRAASGRAPRSPAALCDHVTRLLQAVARQCVLVLVLDDLQWADSGTLNLLAHLGRRLAGSRILLIGIYRRTEVSSEHGLASVAHELQRLHGDVTLDLDRAGGRAFVDALLDSAPNRLDEAFRARLTRQTGGHALFTAALVRQMQEDGALVQDADGRWVAGADLNWSRVPPRVEAVVAERLARLPERERDLLAVASVEGEVFTAEGVAQALGRDQTEVLRALRALGEGGLAGPQHHLVYALGLERMGQRRLARYRFRHALFQQYTYAQLDAVRRAQLHEAVGRALETLHAGQRDGVAARLAYHFEAAGLEELAVDYWLRAGQQAYRLAAPAESVALYRRGLALLKRLPPSKERDRRELELLLHLETSVMTTRGWGAPERAASLQRAYTLGQQLGETSRLLPLLQALASVHVARAEHHVALAYAEQLLDLAEATPEALYTAMGRRMLGTVYFFLGECAQARRHLEAGLQAFVALGSKARASDYALAEEEGVRLYVWLPHVLLMSGYPAQAAAYSREALARARALNYVGAQAIALTTAGAAFYAACRQPQATLYHAEQLSALADKYALPSYQGWATFYQGWALAYQGQPAAGLPDMRAGLDRLEATGTRGSLAHLFMLMAELYAGLGAVQEGERAIDRALALADETGARSNLAEMYRVQGMLRRRQKEIEAAEASFMRAITVAQEQTARLWELRAVMSLCRLRQAEGPRAAFAVTCQQLADLYAWFNEGFDTADLQEAAALLAEGGLLKDACLETE